MNLRKLNMLAMLMVIGFSFAAEKECIEMRDVESAMTIIPAQCKNTQEPKKCFDQVIAQIKDLGLYKKLDKSVFQKVDRVIVKHAKDVRVLGLISLQLVIWFLSSGSVVYTTEMECGKGIMQYVLEKKEKYPMLFNPKFMIVLLGSLAWTLNWIVTNYGNQSTLEDDGSSQDYSWASNFQYTLFIAAYLLALNQLEKMTQKTQGSSAASSPAASPHVTPEKIMPSSPSNLLRSDIANTQTPNRDGKSLIEYANMQPEEEGKVLFGKIKDLEPKFNLALDVD